MCRALWLGGGISKAALTIASDAIWQAALVASDPKVQSELKDLANAGYAELTKTTADRRLTGYEPKPTADLSSVGRSHTNAALGSGSVGKS